ncbi:glycosyltransferase family 1 protein [Leifsonia shinshuensis]|uniref:rhamnosyltransferase WsaF family glycosyltransferase n=1 Tax=Leifsonia shinshuensis TaxID=150026 RepID=UPI001F50A1D1|nr:glycosyltransferase family 1 protein [Leifsonia shinshuensis]MCI0158197.1 glycosyltransferase family 1 protein [Leifsonia shinshuensis]
MLTEQGPRALFAKTARLALRPFRVLRDEGPRSLFARVLGKAHRRLTVNTPMMLVAFDDAAEVDWTTPAPQLQSPISVAEGPIDIAWIMSPPGKESGGHQNLFRFIDFAEQAGHRCTIYLYTSAEGVVSIPEVRAMLATTDAYPSLEADIRIYSRERGVHDSAQALFATGWETAYPAYLDKSSARRFYFVQDFESIFYPLGSESVLAENTYNFGFHGITAGGWLAHKLSSDYGMSTDHFDFAVDKRRYNVVNTERRNEIFFYARPVTPRRGFEFGLLALEEFARLKPDVTINLAGWDVSNWNVPFEYRNLASLEISELNDVYNRCAAGLVLSLSNMSLLPLELLSSGVAPVVNDGPNNRMVSDNPFIEYVPLSPPAIARRLVEVVDRADQVERSRLMSQSVAEISWEDSGKQFVTAFERAMRG